MNIKSQTRPVCPTHQNLLVRKYGPYGGYYACSLSPQCEVTASLSKFDGYFYMTDQAVRNARKSAHTAFDPLWKSKKMSRNAAYVWLATALGLSAKECHMEHFDEEICAKVIELVRQKLAETD